MEKDELRKEVDMLIGQKIGDLKNMTEVGRCEKKRKTSIEIMIGKEEEKEIQYLRRLKMKRGNVTAGNDMVNVTEVGKGRKREVMRIKRGIEEEKSKRKGGVKWIEQKEAEIGIEAERGGEMTKIGKKTGNDEKKRRETGWIKKIEILIRMKRREVIDGKKKAEILTEEKIGQRMR